MNRVLQHHPGQAELVDYASGASAMAQALCISTHLEFCNQCRMTVEQLEGIGGDMIESRAEAGLASDALSQLWQRIDNGPTTVEGGPGPEPVDALPRPLRGLVQNGESGIGWRWSGPSLRRARLALGDPLREVGLLRMAPGGGIGIHDHEGTEWTVVLRGSFSDHNGLYVQGDYLRCDPGDIHRPVATTDGDCVCLLVHEGAIRFTGSRLRWLNPLLRLRPR